MTERPILFNGAMVRAILEGRKTHTRRIAKVNDYGRVWKDKKSWYCDDPNAILTCPWQPGYFLWVRETWAPTKFAPEMPNYSFAADGPKPEGLRKWRPSIHMPRFVSRITLQVTGVHLESLQSITEEGAKEEGAESEEFLEELERAHSIGAEIPGAIFPTARDEFRRIWDGIYRGAQSWDANPWVWDIEFRVAEVKR